MSSIIFKIGDIVRIETRGKNSFYEVKVYFGKNIYGIKQINSNHKMISVLEHEMELVSIDEYLTYQGLTVWQLIRWIQFLSNPLSLSLS